MSVEVTKRTSLYIKVIRCSIKTSKHNLRFFFFYPLFTRAYVSPSNPLLEPTTAYRLRSQCRTMKEKWTWGGVLGVWNHSQLRRDEPMKSSLPRQWITTKQRTWRSTSETANATSGMTNIRWSVEHEMASAIQRLKEQIETYKVTRVQLEQFNNLFADMTKNNEDLKLQNERLRKDRKDCFVRRIRAL
jgi:hypothetical protein